VKIKIKSRK